VQASDLLILGRLARQYWRQGWGARRLFGRTVWQAVRKSPRTLAQMVTYLGMYEHFRKVHADKPAGVLRASPPRQGPAKRTLEIAGVPLISS
jgi:hypothetical protein